MRLKLKKTSKRLAREINWLRGEEGYFLIASSIEFFTISSVIFKFF